ncbi:MAG TPA: thioredoxin family protein [Patescibacteria group bacterium]|nr:thioredoxin family protein [Patescibacteria group bacterium]
MAVEASNFDSNFKVADFMLIGTDGKTYTAKKCWGPKGLLVMFICNHCPYVLAVIDRLVEDCGVLQKAGIGCVAIMPNDTKMYPEDSFENMKLFAKEHRFTFPYLIDELQTTARTYGAVCTPDLFGFNNRGQLRYRGRIDSAGKDEPSVMTRRELRDAMLQIAQTGEGPKMQYPSIGCSIKWK